MKKITIKHLAALLFMLMTAASASAQNEAYAVYTNDGTLTFYYDNQISSRPGSKYGLNSDFDFGPGWSHLCCDIKKVVFKPSFADARPTSTSSWFAIPVGYGIAIGNHRGHRVSEHVGSDRHELYVQRLQTPDQS